MREYRRRVQTTVTAVRLELETEGFVYRKWGGEQRCKAGDWVVNNSGDVYTVDAGSFERTYRMISAGVYEKSGRVWAEVAETAGTIRTKEGATDYSAGDVLVFNEPGGGDGYAMSRSKFERLYEAC
jgi:hypothetical protein